MVSLSNTIKIMSFGVTCTLSISVCVFCMYKLSTNITDSQQLVYISILSSVFSLWIPSPTTMITFKKPTNESPTLNGVTVDNNRLVTSSSQMIETV